VSGEDWHNLRRVEGSLSGDFAYLVAKNADEPCCQSCLSDQWDGVVDEYIDYCCCVHGEKFASILDGEVEWIGDGAEDRYKENADTGDSK
jgi:hypothetical protein